MPKIESDLNQLPALDVGLQLLRTPHPPYYAVISTNIQSGEGQVEYEIKMQGMLAIVKKLPGFLGSEIAYDQTENGKKFKLGVTYWKSLEDIHNWREDSHHLSVKKKGKTLWYDEHNIRICHVIAHYGSNLNQKKTDELAYQETKVKTADTNFE